MVLASASQSRLGPALLLRGEHLDDVARLQRVVERHDLAVDLGPDAAVADVRVDLVREVERRGARRQRLDLALGREDEHLVLEEVRLQRLGELLRVVRVLLPVEQLAQPLDLLLDRLAAVLLVDPVRGHTELGGAVHLHRADLDLERSSLGPDHGRVERLVHVELGHRDHVLEAPWQRLPQRVDDPDRAVAVLDGLDDHAHRREVVDLVELAALLGHLRVDREEVLGAPRDVGVDADGAELLAQVLARAAHVGLTLVALLRDELLDLVVLARVERREGEVLELPLDRVDAEPVRQRREDLERLLGLLLLLGLRHRADRAHVVQAVGQLDEDDPDVLGHRDHHLAVVLSLAVVAALEGDAGELRHAVDELRDLLAELVPDLVERRARVLDGVVQERRAERGRVEAHARADLCDADGVDDEVLSARPALVRVAVAREDVGPLDERAVDLLGGLVGVLLDYGEQVREQDALVVAQPSPGGRWARATRRRRAGRPGDARSPSARCGRRRPGRRPRPPRRRGPAWPAPGPLPLVPRCLAVASACPLRV